jgi:hypothetical protein
MRRNSGLNSGGLDTVHTMQIASDSGPDKYFIIKILIFSNKTAYFAGFCEKINSSNVPDSDQPLGTVFLFHRPSTPWMGLLSARKVR